MHEALLGPIQGEAGDPLTDKRMQELTAMIRAGRGDEPYVQPRPKRNNLAAALRDAKSAGLIVEQPKPTVDPAIVEAHEAKIVEFHRLIFELSAKIDRLECQHERLMARPVERTEGCSMCGDAIVPARAKHRVCAPCHSRLTREGA